jgi:hypothetical protein
MAIMTIVVPEMSSPFGPRARPSTRDEWPIKTLLLKPR